MWPKQSVSKSTCIIYKSYKFQDIYVSLKEIFFSRFFFSKLLSLGKRKEIENEKLQLRFIFKRRYDLPPYIAYQQAYHAGWQGHDPIYTAYQYVSLCFKNQNLLSLP
jgi:hypothetical protein